MNLFGMGLRPPHYTDILNSSYEKPDFVEIHAENFFYTEQHPHILFLKEVREYVPISVHAVGLSLGSAEDLDQDHLRKLKNLCDYIQPVFISEHLAWNRLNGNYFPELFPMPYTLESLNLICEKINLVQETLGQIIFIENPAALLCFEKNNYEETAFLNSISKQTGSKILLDLNNLFISSAQLGFSVEHYLEELNLDAVGEIHLAGHTPKKLENGETVLLDTHNDFVSAAVIDLLKKTLKKIKAPVLLEWDHDLPNYETLLSHLKEIQECTIA